MPKPKDYYQLLGVARSANADEIRKAYRKLARKLHPDVNKESDAAKRFAEVQEAYDVLADDAKRKSYDQFGHTGVGGAGSAAGTWPGNGGRSRGRATAQSSWTNVDPADYEGDFSSIFDQMFGGGDRGGFGARGGPRSRSSTAAQPVQGKHIDHTITVTFMTAALGGTEQIRMGTVDSGSTITVKIPAGIETGAKLRLRGKGHSSLNNGPAGDLILTIEIGKHPYFRREGLDVLVDVPVNIAEAVQGVTVNVPLLSVGTTSTADMKVPPGTSSGARLRIKGRGITSGQGKTGDFYAVVQIIAPSIAGLTENGRQAVQELAAELKNPRESAPYADDLV